MSIFSRLFQRTSEDGSAPGQAEEPQPGAAPATAKPAPDAPAPAAAPAAPPVTRSPLPPAPSAAKPMPAVQALPGMPPAPLTPRTPAPPAAAPPAPGAIAAPPAATPVRPDVKPASPKLKELVRRPIAPAAAPAPATAAAPAPTPPSAPGAAPAAVAAPAPAAAATPATAPTKAPATAPASAPPAPDPAAPTEPMPKVSSEERALARLTAGDGAPSADRAPTAAALAADRAAVLATFEDLAYAHVTQVRNLMVEVRWGEAQTAWIELARPALGSLRRMAAELDESELVASLDGFDAALAGLTGPGGPEAIAGETREALLSSYEPLQLRLPRAFGLDGERERREPIIVQALLLKVPGLERLALERILAAGLGRLETLFRARPDELAAVADLPTDLAAAVVARVQEFHRDTPAPLAAPDPTAARAALAALAADLGALHRSFEEASQGWTESMRGDKRRLRRQREERFMDIEIALARLGEIDLLARFSRLTFERRLEELEHYMRQGGAERPASAEAAHMKARPSGGGSHPGAPAAP
jgi:hypothetical protein